MGRGSLVSLPLSRHKVIAAQALIEGTVNCPNRRLSIRSTNDTRRALISMAPSNPPAAVVYLEGILPRKETAQKPRARWRKNIAFAPDLVAVLVGSVVDFRIRTTPITTSFPIRRRND
jgi:hypothetical protein